MTLFDADWLAEFGPIPWVQPWTEQETGQHWDDLEFEVYSIRGRVEHLVDTAPPRPDRQWGMTGTQRVLARIEARREQLRHVGDYTTRMAERHRRAQAVQWMHKRGWRPDDICHRLHIDTFEYDQLLREAS